MKRVPLHLATAAMRLARPVFDRDGLLVAGAGSALSNRVLQLLRRLAIQTVPVDEDTPVPTWATVADLGGAVREQIERFAREDETGPMLALRDAVLRRLTRQAEIAQTEEQLWHAPREGDPEGRP